jgi:hypothetical protein
MTTLILVEPQGPWGLPSSSVALPQFFFTAPAARFSFAPTIC